MHKFYFVNIKKNTRIFVYHVVKFQVMSVPTFIADIGGMLGFAIGFSVVCAVELVYCIIIRHEKDLKKTRFLKKKT
jgi:Amiloride-sensitive sodium channel